MGMKTMGFVVCERCLELVGRLHDSAAAGGLLGRVWVFALRDLFGIVSMAENG